MLSSIFLRPSLIYYSPTPPPPGACKGDDLPVRSSSAPSTSTVVWSEFCLAPKELAADYCKARKALVSLPGSRTSISRQDNVFQKFDAMIRVLEPSNPFLGICLRDTSLCYRLAKMRLFVCSAKERKKEASLAEGLTTSSWAWWLRAGV